MSLTKGRLQYVTVRVLLHVWTMVLLRPTNSQETLHVDLGPPGSCGCDQGRQGDRSEEYWQLKALVDGLRELGNTCTNQTSEVIRLKESNRILDSKVTTLESRIVNLDLEVQTVVEQYHNVKLIPPELAAPLVHPRTVGALTAQPDRVWKGVNDEALPPKTLIDAPWEQPLNDTNKLVQTLLQRIDDLEIIFNKNIIANKRQVKQTTRLQKMVSRHQKDMWEKNMEYNRNIARLQEKMTEHSKSLLVVTQEIDKLKPVIGGILDTMHHLLKENAKLKRRLGRGKVKPKPSGGHGRTTPD